MNNETSAATPRSVKLRLCGMMFLQYFVQGAYLTIVSVYLQDALHFTTDQIGLFMAAIALGPVLAPFIVGQLVDRLMPTERVLAGCHALAGLAMLGLYVQTSFWPVLVLGTIYSVLYIPTTMLTNSLTFHHLRNRDREFPPVRVWGTIGFIVPSWFILFYFLKGLSGDELSRAQGVAFAVSGVAGIVMGFYCLTLPHTPPNPKGSGRFAPAVVLGLLKRRDFLVLFIVSFFIAGAHNYYFVWNSPLVKEVLARDARADWTQAFTSIGQVAEILAMALLAPALTGLGYKRTMLLGGLAYALRCVVLAAAADSQIAWSVAVGLAALGQALHGFCFAFFMAAAFIYIDRTSPPDVKGSLQTIYGVFVMGLGMVAGGIWGGMMGKAYQIPPPEAKLYEWQPIWLWCAALAGICTLVLAAAFPRDSTKTK